MTIRATGILLLKVWGVVSLVAGLIGLLNTALLFFVRQPTSSDGMRSVLLINGSGAAVSLALGAVLLFGARRIIALIVAEEDATVLVPDGYNLVELQSVVFGGVGVFLAISALRNVAELVYAIVRRPAWDSTGQFAYLIQRNHQELAGAAVQLAFAAALLLNRSALASAWSHARARTSENSDPVEPAG